MLVLGVRTCVQCTCIHSPPYWLTSIEVCYFSYASCVEYKRMYIEFNVLHRCSTLFGDFFSSFDEFIFSSLSFLFSISWITLFIRNQNRKHIGSGRFFVCVCSAHFVASFLYTNKCSPFWNIEKTVKNFLKKNEWLISWFPIYREFIQFHLIQ